MTYVLEGNRIVSRINFDPGVIVAVVEDPNSEAASLLVSRANLADRDEMFLDQLGQTIQTRNDVTP